MRLRTPLVASATVALGLGLALVPVTSASAAPDTQCMRNGISVLKEIGLFSAVAKDGLPISAAVAVRGHPARRHRRRVAARPAAAQCRARRPPGR